MKKFFAILIVALLATSFAFSEETPIVNGGTATGSGIFQAEVIIPIDIAVTYTGSQDLGTIAEGDTKDVSARKVHFAVTGHSGHAFEVDSYSGPTWASTDGGAASLTDDGGVWTTGAPLKCNDSFTVTLDKLTGVTAGKGTFTYTMTVSYVY